MNVAVVGAGLVGRLCAWRLLRDGHAVTLFDKSARADRNSAAFVAAAMLAPLSESADCEPEIAAMGEQSLTVWPRWFSDLHDDTGVQVPWALDGSVAVAHAKDQSDLTHFISKIGKKAELLSTQRLTELEPELAQRFSSAVLLPGEGWLDNHVLLDALALAITHLGGVWHESSHLEIVNSKQLGDYCFDAVLDCRGFGGKGDSTSSSAPLRGVRGELLWVQAPEVNLQRPIRVMHPRYQLYISPRSDNRYVVGATEIESESLAPVTVRSTLELLSALYTVHPGFAEAHVLASYAQLRPAYSDNLPRVEWRGDVLSINGLYRHGYLLGPVVVSSALAMLGDTPSISTDTEPKQSLAAAS